MHSGVYNGALHSKQDFQALFAAFANPLKPHYGTASLTLGKTSAHYSDDIAKMEGFSRPLWGLAPFWAGGGKDDVFADIYRRGLVAGTDPASPAYWGEAKGMCQRLVEMAAMGLGLAIAPDVLWQGLSFGEQSKLAAWLWQINEQEVPDNNWWMFAVLVNLGLKRVGRPYSATRLAKSFDKTERFYQGGGWYHDGMKHRDDYYVSFGIHFYNLLYAALSGDSERAALLRGRAEAFAADFLYWFDDDGEALPYGRSLCYRFAQAAFWSAYVYVGLQAVDLGVVKGMIARHFAQWLETDLTDRDGILTIGYRYPNLRMAETYNAPGSPYWAFKTFLLLALPDEHPFWRVKAKPLPSLAPLKKVGDMLIQRTGGHMCAYPSGCYGRQNLGHMPQKYAKFVYSTKLGFSVPLSDEFIDLAAPDSMLAFVADGAVYVRRESDAFRIEDDCVWSKWSPMRGIVAETTLTPTETGHRRRHVISSAFDCEAYDCGFAVPMGKMYCRALCLSGNGEVCEIAAAPNTSVMFPRTYIPAVRVDICKGETIIETEFEVKLP